MLNELCEFVLQANPGVMDHIDAYPTSARVRVVARE